MNTKRSYARARGPQVTAGRRSVALGFLCLGVALALVTRPALAQTDVPDDPATRAVWAYLTAHGVGQPTTSPLAQDAAAQGVLGYLQAHGMGQSATGQTADANTLGVLGYVQAHASSPSNIVVPAPDAATLGVLDYLRAHALVAEPTGVGATNTAPQSLEVDWVIVLATAVLVGGLIAAGALMRPPTRPTRGGPAHQHR